MELGPLVHRRYWKLVGNTKMNVTYTLYKFDQIWRLPREFEVCRYMMKYEWRDRCDKNVCRAIHRKKLLRVQTYSPQLCSEQIQFTNGGRRHCEVERSPYDECPGFFGVYKPDNSGMTHRTAGMVCPRKYWKCFFFNDHYK